MYGKRLSSHAGLPTNDELIFNGLPPMHSYEDLERMINLILNTFRNS